MEKEKYVKELKRVANSSKVYNRKDTKHRRHESDAWNISFVVQFCKKNFSFRQEKEKWNKSNQLKHSTLLP